MMRMLWALLRRDLWNEASYKLSFLVQLAGNLHVILVFLFLARMLKGAPISSLARYGGAYFPYVLTGVAIQQYLYTALNTYSGQLREAQLVGSFEAVMVCPVPLPIYLLGSAFFAFILNTLHVFVYLGLGVLLGGFRFPPAHLPLLALVLLVSALAFSGLGIFAAAYCVLFKKGNPLAWLLTIVSSLLGGVYFPSAVLPPWLRAVAAWVPTTHCLEAMRGVLLEGKGLAGVAGPLGLLALWALVGVPLGCLGFAWAVRRGRRQGTLGTY